MQLKLNAFVREQCVTQNPVTLKPFQCQQNKCVCIPKVKCDEGVQCGFQDDGCGGKL